MKIIEVDDELYAYIASQTKSIGEDASQILRRLLLGDSNSPVPDQQIEQEMPAPHLAAEEQQANNANNGEKSSEAVGDIKTKITAKSLADMPKKVDRFLFALSQLYHCHPGQFSAVEQIRGTDRLYFAQSQAALLESGKSTNPKSIPGTPFWVVTNNNSQKKTRLLSQAMNALGYSEDDTTEIVTIINQS